MKLAIDLHVAKLVFMSVIIVVSASLGLLGCADDLDSGQPTCSDGRCDETDWQTAFTSTVDTEVTRLSTYASNDANAWGACVSTWTVGGAAIGELASKTCVLVGVATIETGVGAVAAAVCVGADASQADALLGAAIGYMVGYLACSDKADFTDVLGSFKVFNADASKETDTPTSEVEDWNTPECQAKYNEYKLHCDKPRSCTSAQLSCEDLLYRQSEAKQCADLRQDHLYGCPHPNDYYDWEGHKQALAEAYIVQQRCERELCQSNCVDLLPFELISTLSNICSI